MIFQPTHESISSHVVPDWYHNAKLGIFIHWGLYSVPGWAPAYRSPHDVMAAEGWESWFTNNPYAEWYSNSLRIAGSPTAAYHAATFPPGFAYEQFAPQFNEANNGWDPAEWAALFETAGARYVVLTTKHHDGFLLWPSVHPNLQLPGYGSTRDLVGELTEAVRNQGMKMGLYYSGGLDWTFVDRPIVSISDLFACIPQSAEYINYSNAHLRELIDRYAPSVLWNDIGYPRDTNLNELFAYYYNSVSDGVVNDRFVQVPRESDSSLAAEASVQAGIPPKPAHSDFRTPEYATYSTIMAEKWEATRGLGYSFGYNRNEGPESILSATELIRLFIDIVSKNGNLLINVGPLATGIIATLQRERLLALGTWLGINGAAMYGTRPWTRAEGKTTAGVPVRFTQRDNVLYAILLDTPRETTIQIEGMVASSDTNVRALGQDAPAIWEQRGEHLAVILPDLLPDAPAHVIRVAPQPLSVTAGG